MISSFHCASGCLHTHIRLDGVQLLVWYNACLCLQYHLQKFVLCLTIDCQYALLLHAMLAHLTLSLLGHSPALKWLIRCQLRLEDWPCWCEKTEERCKIQKDFAPTAPIKEPVILTTDCHVDQLSRNVNTSTYKA